MGKMQLTRKIFGRNKTRKRKFTHITMVEIVVLVRNLVVSGVITVVALLFGKLAAQVANGIERLEQHREQYCSDQNRIYDGKPFFHFITNVNNSIKAAGLFNKI